MPMYSVHKEYCLLFMVGGLLYFGLQCEGSVYPNPINCAYVECPTYDVVHTEARFEIRAYREANWIAFRAIGSRSFKDASTKGFGRLFDYIHGNNKDGINMSITAPILVDIGTSTGSSPYIVNFFLPEKYQANPPLPISIIDRPVKFPPKRFAAVGRFGGFSDDKIIPSQALALKRSLRRTVWAAASFVQLYSQAGYNAPFERENRVNEIWIWFDQ